MKLHSSKIFLSTALGLCCLYAGQCLAAASAAPAQLVGPGNFVESCRTALEGGQTATVEKVHYRRSDNQSSDEKIVVTKRYEDEAELYNEYKVLELFERVSHRRGQPVFATPTNFVLNLEEKTLSSPFIAGDNLHQFLLSLNDPPERQKLERRFVRRAESTIEGLKEILPIVLVSKITDWDEKRRFFSDETPDGSPVYLLTLYDGSLDFENHPLVIREAIIKSDNVILSHSQELMTLIDGR